MVFSSTAFLYAFLPGVLLAYFLTPSRLKNIFLLLTSLFFYAWGESWFVLVLLASIVVDYCAALIISGGFGRAWKEEIPLLIPGPRSRIQRLGLALSLVANLGILGFFKYFGFGVESFNAALTSVGFSDWRWEPTLQVLLPLGVSFFTFQSMSYTLDVYQGKVRATRNLIQFATFVSMFPQLVAGPIVRYREIEESLRHRRVTLEDYAYGVRRFVIGLSKKVLIANAFAGPADRIFAIPDSELTTGLAWLGVAAYTFQIYFDFSGYSDMAIGLGRMFGFRFPENFRYPYYSTSITEFWRRWHISLSTWFRDYLYFPLGGNRRGRYRTYLNLWLVFLLCGLWHGASWNFVVWGVFHGLLLVLERRFSGIIPTHLAWRAVRHLYVVMAFMVGWVFFRANTLEQAWNFLAAMTGFAQGSGSAYYPALYFGNELALWSVVAILGSGPILPLLGQWLTPASGEDSHPTRDSLLGVASVAVMAGLLVLCSMKLASTTHNPFIYFRF
ncbi:MAG: MBOAT family protein [Thermoanaerobaculia bacterium]|nr:MBOAT family protein [Thermoanaerobaculia bacterium]